MAWDVYLSFLTKCIVPALSAGEGVRPMVS